MKKTNAKIPTIKKPDYRFDHPSTPDWVKDQVKKEVEFCEENFYDLTKRDIIKRFKKLTG